MKDYNGNQWPKQWVLIRSTYGVELRETYLNQRHAFYVLCAKTLQETKA
jgi:hypothetical protein